MEETDQDSLIFAAVCEDAKDPWFLGGSLDKNYDGAMEWNR